jgi:hypothetical protein
MEADGMRLGRLTAGVMAGLVAGALVGALPAAAHTEVEVEPAVGGAANASVTFDAEAEWDKAGIGSVKVSLPAGIAPADVSYASGPTGWALTPDADGFVVTGPALAAGKDAKYAVQVKQLPSTPTVAFKVLVTYTDGHVDRWIELPSAANPKPDNPAAIATLQAPPGGFQTVVPSPTQAAPSAPPTSPSPAGPQLGGPSTPATTSADPAADDSTGAWPWILAAVVALIAIGGGVLWLRRRRAA